MESDNTASFGRIDFTCEPSPATKSSKKCDLTIRCPAFPCSPVILPWQCNRCEAIIEYGIIDNNFHCLCGSSKPEQCLFRCDHHDYRSPGERKLKRALSTLKAPYECNILILGETGVGKSTFINAFANHISYSTLEEAINGQLHTPIPNTFKITDGNNESVVINYGLDTQDADFTSGQSATQNATIHKFHFGSVILRLIDTPGFGDLRGTAQDEKNFENILNTIASLDELHCIIVLLKPSSNRLTLTLQYCVEELLCHLNNAAKDNIIFGFSNTSFLPEDTMPPLLELLAKTNVSIKCTKENVFCFDSEGYRFMAAHSQGIRFSEDLFNSSRESWDFSEKEIARLFSYVRQLTLHSTGSTLVLSELSITGSSTSSHEVCHRFRIRNNGNLILKALSLLPTVGDGSVFPPADGAGNLMKSTQRSNKPLEIVVLEEDISVEPMEEITQTNQRPNTPLEIITLEEDVIAEPMEEIMVINPSNTAAVHFLERRTNRASLSRMPRNTEKSFKLIHSRDRSCYALDGITTDLPEDLQATKPKSTLQRFSHFYEPPSAACYSEVIDLSSEPPEQGHSMVSSTVNKRFVQGDNESAGKYIRRCLTSLGENSSERGNIDAIIYGLKLEYWITVAGKPFTEIHDLIKHLESVEAYLHSLDFSHLHFANM